MTNILPFRKPKDGKPAEPHRGPAAIVIFPGVRYERLDDGKATTPRRGGTRRKA